VHQSGSEFPNHDGRNSFLFWPPAPPQAKQLRVIVSTLWEAAWALVDIPGRLFHGLRDRQALLTGRA
jgi:hypothetical protein